MRRIFILLALIIPTITHAQQTTDIDIALANGQVQDAVDFINQSEGRINSLQSNIDYNQSRIDEWKAEIISLSQKIKEKKDGLTYVATKDNPVQAAIDALNANPEWAQGINWYDTDAYRSK